MNNSLVLTVQFRSPPPFPGAPRGQARCQPLRRRKGTAAATARHPRCYLSGNNPHYLSPLGANQTESLMREGSLPPLGGNGRPEGRGTGKGGGAEVAPSGLAGAFGAALIQVLNTRETRTSAFKVSRWEELFI